MEQEIREEMETQEQPESEQAFQEAAEVVESNPQYEMRFALLEWLEKLIKSF